MTKSARPWPGTPIAEQPDGWIGEAQELDGTWTPITEPGHLRDVTRATRSWRERQATQGHLIETRVVLPPK